MATLPGFQNPFGLNSALFGGSPGPGLMGSPPATGTGLMGATPGTPQGDALTAFAGSMLAGSGYSPTRQTGSEVFGRALLAAQQARAASMEQIQKQRYQEAQIAALEREKNRSPFGTIDPDQFTPESLAEFQRTGNYGVLKPRGGLSGIGNFNPGDYTPSSFSKFLKTQDPNDLVRYVTPANPSVQIVNGVPTVVQPDRGGGTPKQNPLSTLPSELDAAKAKAAAESQAKAEGTAAGEAVGGRNKKDVAAQNTLQTLDIAEPLVDVATGSATGAAADKVAAFFGKSLDGAKATAQLKILQTSLVLGMPRMEGPQSDRDAQLYVEAAGSIGDPTVPREQKKAAIITIRQLQKRYTQPSNASPSGYTLVPGSAPDGTVSPNINDLLDKYAPRK